MPTVTIRLTDEMMHWIESQVRPFHKKSDVIRDLIVSRMNGLTDLGRLPAYRVGAGTQLDSSVLALSEVNSNELTDHEVNLQKSTIPKKSKKSSRPKKENLEPLSLLVQNAFFEKAELPPELESSREAFIHFGKVKKGDRGQHGAKLAATGLRKIGEKYGWDIAKDQLDLAINNRWNGITLNNYEKFAANSKSIKDDQPRHPASRLFTAERGFDNEVSDSTNNLLGGLL